MALEQPVYWWSSVDSAVVLWLPVEVVCGHPGLSWGGCFHADILAFTFPGPVVRDARMSDGCTPLIPYLIWRKNNLSSSTEARLWEDAIAFPRNDAGVYRASRWYITRHQLPLIITWSVVGHALRTFISVACISGLCKKKHIPYTEICGPDSRLTRVSTHSLTRAIGTRQAFLGLQMLPHVMIEPVII